MLHRNNTSNLKGFDHIKNYLNRLDEQKILNLKNVIAIAEEYPENSKSRMEIAKQFFRLAKFANIPDLKKFEEWAIPTQQAYKPKKRERLTDVKTVSGVFTGSYAIHPFTEKKIPIWISDYVIASYGTGAVMGVPAGDQRAVSYTHLTLPTNREV